MTIVDERVIPSPEVAEEITLPEHLQEDGMRPRFGRIPKILGRVAAFGALAAFGGATSSVMAAHYLETPTTLGPNEATIRLTADSNQTLDVGLGKIIKPLDNTPFGAGVYLDIGEVPLDQDAGSETLSTDALIDRYAGFFANPDRDGETAKDALVGRMEDTAIAGGLVTLFGSLGLYSVVGAARRKELLEHAPRKLQASLAAVTLLFTMVPAETAHAIPEAPPANPIFKDTPLEGAYVTGQLLTALTDSIVPKVIEKVRENKQFYDKLEENLRLALEDGGLLTSATGTITLMHTSDKHCNMNINKPLGVIAKWADVDHVIDTGDSVLGGTPLDAVCTDSNNYYLKKYDRIVVEGNHRSPDTVKREQKHGARVLDGKVVEVDHVRYLGGPNQTISLFGSQVQPVGEESNADMGHRLAEAACNDPRGVDVFVGATPDAVRETLERGCANLALVGGRVEKFEQISALNGRQIPTYRVGTTGGVRDGELTMGPLLNPATVALIQLDKITRKPLRQQTITFNPDMSVIIGKITDWAPISTVETVVTAP